MRPVGLASRCQLRFSILTLCVARRLEADPGGWLSWEPRLSLIAS